jgi:pyruvate formate lyase activating enzyme
MHEAIVTNIQGYSIHDGPGIRTTVFLKGCPLSCAWCSNPENISAKIEIGFVDSLCARCGKCRDACRHGAIRTGGDEYRIDQSRCQGCGTCQERCLHEALVRYGERMTVHDVWEAVRRDKMFYEASGGGVTVSGGEPLLQPAFVRELFDLCRTEGIGTCVETCGFVGAGALREVMTVTDTFLFDLKHMDSGIHKSYTGEDNPKILENAAMLIESGADVLFRQPLIPGVNDSRANVEATSCFLRNLGVRAQRIELMPYHRMGQAKYRALDRRCSMDGVAVMGDGEIERVRSDYLDRGVACTISR